MATGFGALRDEHLGLCFQSLTRDRQILYLANQLRAAPADLSGEGARIAEGQHHCCRPVGERQIEQLRPIGQAPGDEADADARAFGLLILAADPVGVAVAAADQAQAAGARYSRRQRTARDKAHWRQHQRFVDTQELGDHAVRPARSLSFCALIMSRMRCQSASESLSSSVKYAPEPVAR